MAIINSNRYTKKDKIKAQISSEVSLKIEEYCKWAGIEDIGYFIEEAACFVFSKDKEWKEHQRLTKRSKKKEDQLS